MIVRYGSRLKADSASARQETSQASARGWHACMGPQHGTSRAARSHPECPRLHQGCRVIDRASGAHTKAHAA